MIDQTLLTLLTQLQRSVSRLFNHRVRDFGLTRPQWRVISGLHGHGGISQTELAEIVSIARSPLGKIIDHLEEVGWVERQADPEDRRVKRLYLTSAIEPLLEPTGAIAQALEDELLEGWPVEQREALRSALQRLQRRALRLSEAEFGKSIVRAPGRTGSGRG